MMNPNTLEMSPTHHGNLLLFEEASSSSYSSRSRMFLANNPNRAPLPKYLEEYYSDVLQMERAVSAKCNECGTVVKGSLGVTSNFLRHLRQRHPLIEVRNAGRPYSGSPVDHVFMVDYHQQPTSTSSIKMSSVTSVVPVVNSNVILPDPSLFNHPKQRALAESTMKWLTTDALPLSIVEEKGFQEFCKNLDPSFAKVTRRALNRMMTSKVTNEILPTLRASLSQIEDGNLHLTVDVFGRQGSSVDQGVFALRAYYINDQWELRHHTLGFATIENEREETDNLLAACASKLADYGVDLNKVGTITTGNAWKTLNTSYSHQAGQGRQETKEAREQLQMATAASSLSSRANADDFLGIPETEERGEKHLPGGAEIRICKTEVASDDLYDEGEEEDEEDEDSRGADDPLTSQFECLQAEHLPGVIDALHRAARKAIRVSPALRNIMADLARLLDYAGRHPRWRDDLLDHLPRKFRAVLKRNWNSQIDLLQWYSEDEVYNALATRVSNAWNDQVQRGGLGETPPPLPTQESLYDCKVVFNHLFSPLSEAVDTLQAEGALASLVIPAMCGIVQAIWAVKEAEEVKKFASVANSVVRGIDFGRCKNIREHDVFILATILDPRFKLTAFPDDCAVIRLHDLPNRKEAVKILREAFDSVDFQQTAQPLVATAASPSSTNSSVMQQMDTSGAQDLANKKIFSFYIDRPIKKARQETEVDSYLAEDANPTYNPLSYWKVKEVTWPRLAMVAKKVLSIPTGQGSPNRLFATAKDVSQAQRWQIDLATLENMVLYREHSA